MSLTNFRRRLKYHQAVGTKIAKAKAPPLPCVRDVPPACDVR